MMPLGRQGAFIILRLEERRSMLRRGFTCLRACGGRMALRRGFTLVEVLVAVALMVLLVTVMVVLFNGSLGAMMETEARLDIQRSARAAMDHLRDDLSSVLPMDGGSQRFWMRDNAIDPRTGGVMALSDPDRHVTGACDAMGFNAVTSIGGTRLPARIIYRLVKDVDPARHNTVQKVVNGRIRPGRPLYILRKELLDLDGRPLRDPTSGRPVEPVDLCYYVMAFNLEYLHAVSDDPASPLSRRNDRFCQIAPDRNGSAEGPFPGPVTSQIGPDVLAPIPARVRPVNPMGEADGASDGSSAIRNDIRQTARSGARFRPAFTVPAVRVTLRVVEDVEARQERVYTRVIRLPAG